MAACGTFPLFTFGISCLRHLRGCCRNWCKYWPICDSYMLQLFTRIASLRICIPFQRFLSCIHLNPFTLVPESAPRCWWSLWPLLATAGTVCGWDVFRGGGQLGRPPSTRTSAILGKQTIFA